MQTKIEFNEQKSEKLYAKVTANFTHKSMHAYESLRPFTAVEDSIPPTWRTVTILNRMTSLSRQLALQHGGR